MAVSASTVSVINYLKSIGNENVTAADVAEALGMEKRQVDGCFTSGLCRKGLGVRIEAEVKLTDGTHQKVKFLKLTEAGKNWTPDSEATAE